MELKYKALKIGSLVITTNFQLDNANITIQPQEVWDLFIRALKEDKIVFTSSNTHKIQPNKNIFKKKTLKSLFG